MLRREREKVMEGEEEHRRFEGLQRCVLQQNVITRILIRIIFGVRRS